MLNHTASSSPLPSEKRHFISLRPRPGSARASQPLDRAITTEGAPGTSAEIFLTFLRSSYFLGKKNSRS